MGNCIRNTIMVRGPADEVAQFKAAVAPPPAEECNNCYGNESPDPGAPPCGHWCCLRAARFVQPDDPKALLWSKTPGAPMPGPKERDCYPTNGHWGTKRDGDSDWRVYSNGFSGILAWLMIAMSARLPRLTIIVEWADVLDESYCETDEEQWACSRVIMVRAGQAWEYEGADKRKLFEDSLLSRLPVPEAERKPEPVEDPVAGGTGR